MTDEPKYWLPAERYGWNGDKILAHGGLVSHSASAAQGKKTLQTLAAMTIPGGTGKLTGIRGMVRTETSADLTAGVNTGKGELEYWLVN